MSLLQRLLPAYASPQILAKGALQVVRERALQALILAITTIAAMAGVALMILNPGIFAQAQQFAYIAVFLWLLVILVWREVPYNLRAGTVIAILYVLALLELFNTSSLGFILIWLATAALLTSLLFGFRPALVSIFLSTLTLIGIGWGLQSHWVQLPFARIFYLGSDWVIATLGIALLSTGITSVSSSMLHSLHQQINQREKLFTNLEKSRGALEDEVERRTDDIARRLAQVRTAAEISNAISQLNDPETLYQKVVELIQERFHLYYVGIFLVDEYNRYAVLAAGSGNAGRTMLANHHRLQIGTNSMIGWCILNRRSRIALDVGQDAVRFNNPSLPLTRSELALPILSREVAMGALTVQSRLAEDFDENDILVLQGIADGLAAAIVNTRLVSELKQNLDELRGVNRTYLHQAWSEVTEERGQLSYAYQSALPAESRGSSIEIPIILRDQVIAKLNLDTIEANLSPEEQDFLEALTTQTALALENARLVEKTERRANQEQTLNDLSARFSNALDIDSLLKTAVEALGRLPSVAEVSVELIPPDLIGNPAAPQPGNAQEKAI